MIYSENFNKAIKFLLSPETEGGLQEAGWENGGLTKFGISKRAYPHLDITNLTMDQAIQIFYNDFWMRNKCEQMPFKIAIAVFDSSVNQGQGTAAKLLQLALGITADGVVGPKTLLAVNKSNHKKTLTSFMAERAIRYPDYDDWPVAKRGWMRRLFRVVLEGI